MPLWSPTCVNETKMLGACGSTLRTPHVLVFTPVVERLQREGLEVVLTARDHAQTLDLAREQWRT